MFRVTVQAEDIHSGRTPGVTHGLRRQTTAACRHAPDTHTHKVAAQIWLPVRLRRRKRGLGMEGGGGCKASNTQRERLNAGLSEHPPANLTHSLRMETGKGGGGVCSASLWHKEGVGGGGCRVRGAGGVAVRGMDHFSGS